MGTIAVKSDEPGIAVLKRLYVDAAYRGKGLGAKLLDKAMTFCREKGFKKITLDTQQNFVRAQELYKSRGFVITDPQTGACNTCCPIYMEKSLF